MNKIKTIVASEDVKGLINRGFEVDTEMKNLKFEDQGIKKALSDKVKDELADEKSIRLDGDIGSVLVTKAEKFEVKKDEEIKTLIMDNIEKDLLGNVVKVVNSIDIPSEDAKRAADILIASGIDAVFTTKLSVDAKKYQEMDDNKHLSDHAKSILTASIDESVSYRLKFDRLKEKV